MKEYKCNLCQVVKHTRKAIRKHAKEVHDLKGLPPEGEPHSPRTTSNISQSYLGVRR